MGFFAKMVNDTEKSVNPMIVVTIMLTVAVIVWGSWEAYHTSHMPSNLTDAAYLIGGAGAANLAHKASDIVASMNKTPAPPPPSAFPTPPPMVMPPQ